MVQWLTCWCFLLARCMKVLLLQSSPAWRSEHTVEQVGWFRTRYREHLLLSPYGSQHLQITHHTLHSPSDLEFEMGAALFCSTACFYHICSWGRVVTRSTAALRPPWWRCGRRAGRPRPWSAWWAGWCGRASLLEAGPRWRVWLMDPFRMWARLTLQPGRGGGFVQG